ncbi:MAG: hypothetical protein RL732_796 [Bacteroidota bacterium]|jgi:hypothetical protein
MIAKIKSPVFIDALTVELAEPPQSHLRAILRDDRGCECSRLEIMMPNGQHILTWRGLNDLPYGQYTLELSHGEEETSLRLVKRV